MLLGEHTINETKDLIRAKDIGRTDLANARAELSSAPDDTWDADYKSFNGRYEAAKDFATVTMKALSLSNPFVSDNYLIAEPAYQAILDTLSKTPGTIQKGDFQDLWNRVEGARGSPIPENIASIQPSKTTVDADLEAYKVADSIIKKAGDPLKNKTRFIVGASILGTLAGIVFLRKLV